MSSSSAAVLQHCRLRSIVTSGLSNRLVWISFCTRHGGIHFFINIWGAVYSFSHSKVNICQPSQPCFSRLQCKFCLWSIYLLAVVSLTLRSGHQAWKELRSIPLMQPFKMVCHSIVAATKLSLVNSEIESHYRLKQQLATQRTRKIMSSWTVAIWKGWKDSVVRLSVSH